MPEQGDSLVDDLALEVEAVVRSVVPSGSRCALVGFPNHDNAGDSAIWLGQKILLQRLGAEIVYVCDVRTYVPDALDTALDGGIVLLTGGGNLGDVWPRQQRLRERVLEDFPGIPVVQLPQSIHFRDSSSEARFRDVVGAHGEVTVLARDRQSLERAQALGGRALLCPDLAFVLGPIEVDEPRAAPIVWLARSDRESLFPGASAAGVDILRLDWMRPFENEPAWSQAATEAWETALALTGQIEQDPASAPDLAGPLAAAYEILAAQRVERGCRILRRGEVVVTDRLHGHILSMLLGLRNIVMDQSYGKTRSFYETWTYPSELTTWADSPQEAIAAARRLLA